MLFDADVGKNYSLMKQMCRLRTVQTRNVIFFRCRICSLTSSWVRKHGYSELRNFLPVFCRKILLFVISRDVCKRFIQENSISVKACTIHLIFLSGRLEDNFLSENDFTIEYNCLCYVQMLNIQ